MELLEYINRWNSQRLGSLFREQKKKNTHFARRNALKFTYGSIVDKPEYDMTPSLIDTYSKYTLVDEGDIVINCLNLNYDFVSQRVAIVKNSGIITSAYISLRARNADINPLYYCYYFKAMDACKMFHGMGTGIRLTLSYNELRNVPIPVPPRAEQDQIVRFLDWKVSEINKLIGIRRKEIQEFNQLKNTVITKTVTTGLKREELCGTDNSYYRMIPKGWRITKTRRVLSQPLTDGPHTTPQLYEEGIPFVSAEAVSCGNGKIDFNHIRGFISQDFYAECCKKYVPKIDDIYMIKSGATTGRVSIVDTDRIFTIWSPLAVFRCNQEVMLPHFLFYALQALPYQQQVQDGWSYGTQQNIGMRVLEQLKLAYPDVTEQEKIACYLDDKCDMLDKAIQLAESKVKALQELKSTIISDVVTGKIDVRNVTIPEYEHIDDIYDDNNENSEETDVTETNGEEA